MRKPDHTPFEPIGDCHGMAMITNGQTAGCLVNVLGDSIMYPGSKTCESPSKRRIVAIPVSHLMYIGKVMAGESRMSDRLVIRHYREMKLRGK